MRDKNKTERGGDGADSVGDALSGIHLCAADGCEELLAVISSGGGGGGETLNIESAVNFSRGPRNSKSVLG